MTISDKSYPTDAIGNPIRKDDLVRVALSEAALVFSVVDVQPAGTIIGVESGEPMILNGTITIAVTIPIQFQPGAVMGQILVLKKPEVERAN